MRAIPERLLSVLSDYLELTKTNMSSEDQDAFFKNEAVGRLSTHPSHTRIRAGLRVRKESDGGVFSLLPAEWIDSLYDLSIGEGDRVWVTRGGFRFHETRDCKALADGQSKANAEGKDTYNPQFIKRDEAIRYGKRPCQVCKPSTKAFQ